MSALSYVDATTSTVSWSAIVVAVLGSSALGAIVGGVITTLMRGRIERDEAWRSRLVDASEAFLAQLDGLRDAIPYSWVVAIESGDQSLRSDGKLTAATQHAMRTFQAEKASLAPLLTRIKLLFNVESAEVAARAFRNLDNAASLLDGSLSITDAISQYGTTCLEISPSTEFDPAVFDRDEFDPEEDSCIAAWARLLLESASGHSDEFVARCVLRINSTRPSQLGL